MKPPSGCQRQIQKLCLIAEKGVNQGVALHQQSCPTAESLSLATPLTPDSSRRLPLWKDLLLSGPVSPAA